MSAGLLPDASQSELSGPSNFTILSSAHPLKHLLYNLFGVLHHSAYPCMLCFSSWEPNVICTPCAAVVSAAESLGGLAKGNAEGLQDFSSAIRSATETLGAYLPWPLADPEVQLGIDVASIVALKPQWPGVGRLLVSLWPELQD